MKYLNLTFIAALFLYSCGSSQNTTNQSSNTTSTSVETSVTPTEKFVKTVDAATFKTLIEKEDGIILDVRTPQEVASGQIPNASTINLYDEDFIKKINLMQKDKIIYVYCRSGARSAQAAQILSENGFDRIYNLQGGIGAWQSQGYTITAPTAKPDPNIKSMTLSDFNELLKTEKPVLIDFHTVWCAPCVKMAPIIDQIEDEFGQKAVVKRVDVDKSKEVGEAYNIKGVPVFIIFKKGKQVWQHNGIIAKEEIVKELNKHL
ncbi:MAG: thioredoxin fold domain-containing protein [Bacteroidetes bacterium]|nr:thioredoxin fold domain-containing protein [Bacteroidota bacterium]